jgi:DMSO/TMAO reductase YedYZ heme-binding membrane subunit
MPNIEREQRIWFLVLIGVVLLALILVLVGASEPPNAMNWIIRTAALVGYVSLFGAILASAYLREMIKLFGRPFLKVHHGVSIAAWVAILVHPLTLAYRAASLNVFVPDLSSWDIFLTLGGRPGWWLVLIATGVALVRGRIGRGWKVLHSLNYIAFWLITAHAILIGTSFQSTAMRVLAIIMALVVLYVLVKRRMDEAERARRRRERESS